MTPDDVTLTVELDEEQIARIDELAAKHALTREEMFLVLVRAGLDEHERRRAAPTAEGRRG